MIVGINPVIGYGNKYKYYWVKFAKNGIKKEKVAPHQKFLIFMFLKFLEPLAFLHFLRNFLS